MLSPPRMRFPGLLWLGLAVALAWVAWVAWPWSAQPSVEAQHAASVEVKLGSVAHVVLASGWAQPKYKVDLGAQVSGQVETIHVAPGDSVQRGDLLLSLSTQLARNDLLQAQSNLGQQQAAMAIKRFERNQAQRDLERQRLSKALLTSASAQQSRLGLPLGLVAGKRAYSAPGCAYLAVQFCAVSHAHQGVAPCTRLQLSRG